MNILFEYKSIANFFREKTIMREQYVSMSEHSF